MDGDLMACMLEGPGDPVRLIAVSKILESNRRKPMLTAADVMTTDVITVTPETPVPDIAKLLYTRRISGVPVVDPNKAVIGLVSEGDLMKHADAIGEQRRSWWLTLIAGESTLAHDYVKIHGRHA